MMAGLVKDAEKARTKSFMVRSLPGYERLQDELERLANQAEDTYTQLQKLLASKAGDADYLEPMTRGAALGVQVKEQIGLAQVLLNKKNSRPKGKAAATA